MRWPAALLAPILALAAAPLAAQTVVYEQVIEETVTEYAVDADSERYSEVAPAPVPSGIASYGPFRVLDARRAALVDVTDSRAPAQFAAMLQAFPGIATLEMIECPGTVDDRANMRVGVMIRANGIATHVPRGGSVRSGAVELFVAGARRIADDGAEFAVHSWLDETGHEPGDYAASAAENSVYTDYYQAMGLAADEAKAFYAMTNSVSSAQAKWMTAAEMAQWVRLDSPARPLDSALALN